VNKIVSPIAALVALGIICGMVTVLVLKARRRGSDESALETLADWG